MDESNINPKLSKTIKEILNKVDDEEKKSVRELIEQLSDQLYETHLNIYAHSLQWLAKHIRTLHDAKLLTGGDFKKSMELIKLINKVKRLGLTEVKQQILLNSSGYEYKSKILNGKEKKRNLYGTTFRGFQ